MFNMVVSHLVVLFVLSCALVWCFQYYAHKKELIDHPNERSAHTTPTPRGAGMVFVGLWIIFAVLSYYRGFISLLQLFVFVPGGFLVSLIGYCDDTLHVPSIWRFLVQLSAAVMTLIALGGFPRLHIGVWLLHWGSLGSILSIIALIWSANLYNFMDGSDGMAGVEALFVFGIGGYFIWNAGGQNLALLSWGVAALVAGFLVWNWPKAKVFMGDVGSTFLGFLVVAFALAGDRWYQVSPLLWLIPYGVFCYDATFTLVRRVIAGKPWDKPHREFAFHRANRAGFSHQQILWVVIVINTGLMMAAYWLHKHPRYPVAVFVGSIMVVTVIYLWIEHIYPMHRSWEK